ncbi:UvrD-helicase domain-containing protein [Streptomyces sp. NPDC002619]|uniref:UvrD-helicase domain-containing protein n=1 Tax=Streptomyces sp. NPDC002619 TaxID=3364655 RepID=UPI0036AF55C4
MPKLGVAKDFLVEYAKLQKPVQKAVDDAITKFAAHTHAGLHLEKLAHARDPRIRTIRIDKFWRGVVLAPEVGDDYCLISVRPHDDAIEYARSRRFGVNAVLGVLEVRNEQALEAITPAMEHIAGTTEKRLLGEVSDADLLRLGIDRDLLPLVRLLTTEAHLDALQKIIPENQYDVLLALAAEMDPDEVWQQVAAQQLPDGKAPDVVDAEDIGAAMERSQGRIALVDGPEELLGILARPFDAWRVFLHPTQRRVAYRPSYAGSAQVTGGPGTGKTVVALHRVAHLVRGLADGQRILLTTYTKALAAGLRQSLALLLDEEHLRQVDVVHVDSLAHQLVRTARGGQRLEVVLDSDEKARWGRIIRELELPWTEPFLAQEYRHVVLAQSISSLEEYLKAPRRGRGSQLGPVQRAKAWRAVEMFTQQLRDEGKFTHLQIADEAARVLAARGEPAYRHVVVDEAQDLHPAQWRMLRACVAEGPDDLFVAGDPHQRIYDNRVSLRSLGIKVAGRSAQLWLNYRTTHEILTWATALLTGESFDSLDGNDDGGIGQSAEGLDGYRSTLHGTRPVLHQAASQIKELDALVDQIRAWTKAGVLPQEIGVAARTRKLGDLAAERLTEAGLDVAMLRNDPPPERAAVRIGTMHAIKGLEYRCMTVIGVTAHSVPAASAVTPIEVDRLQHQTDMLAERCLLFVACTRAREGLFVSWNGEPSPFLPA